MNQRLSILLILGALLILGSIIYSNTLDAPFVFDDEPFIVYNTKIKDLTNLPAIWDAAAVPSRFLSFLSFAVNYHFHRLDVTGYHFVNIVIHLINAMLVYWMVGRALGPVPIVNHRRLMAAGVALLFLTHPIQTQAVTYITQRFTSLATMFYLLTICMYAKGRADRHWGFLLAAAVTAVAAMFTKEIALTLPVAVLMYELYFVGATPRGRPGSGGHRGPPLRIIGILAFLLIIPAVYSFNAKDILTIEHQSGSYNGEPINNVTYLLTQFRVIVTYLKVLVWPFSQNLLYEFPASRSLWELPTLLSFLGLLTLLIGGISLRNRAPLVSFGILWFFLTLSVESSVIVIRHVIFEHRAYLPSVGFFMALAGTLSWLLPRRIYLVAIIVLAATLSCLTYQRNAVWRSKIALWSDVVEKSPGLLKARLNLGAAYAEEGKFLEAIRVYDGMISRAPNAEAFSNRGNVYSLMREYDLAIEDYTKSLAIKPRSAMALTNRGDAYLNRGDPQAAIDDYSKAVEVNPEYYLAYAHRGHAYRAQRKFTLAEKDYNETLRRNPYEADAYMGIGIVAFSQHDFAKAYDYFSQVLKLEKNNVSALLNRANALSELGKFDEAMRDYDRAIALAPENGQIFYNRAILWKKIGQAGRAAEDMETAKALGYVP